MHLADKDMTPERFQEISRMFNTTLRNFELLGEASRNRFLHGEIPLRQHIDNVRAAAIELAQKCAEI